MNEPAFLHRGVEVWTLRQVDRASAVQKGTAFRAFKRRLPVLVEDRDFFVETIAAPSDEATARLLARMREAGALYQSSQAAILVTRNACTQMQGVASLRSQ
ncbi:hypothetical protein FPL09_06650 [Spiribacter vilamensis]|nr:hypothetical protein FPL09_06650 [Spiribacter vilamensis]